MNNVILFPNRKQQNEEPAHCSGEAICLQCKHQWVAVVPYSDSQFECPNCSTFHGVFKYGYAPSLTWTCKCGNQLFFITKEGSMCPVCGIHTSHD